MIDNTITTDVIFRWYYRKEDGTIVRPKNGKPFPIRIFRKKKL